MNLSSLILFFGQMIDLLGVLIIVFGVVFATARFFASWVHNLDMYRVYKLYRQNLGKVILLGLEFLIAGDLIRSVGGTPTFNSVVILGIIVLIRSFLGVTFEMEIEGKWPWERKRP